MALSILVVDDSAVSRKLTIRALPPELEAAITQAANGSEALAALDAKPHALVLLDLNMPVMDGYQFLEAIVAGRAVVHARPTVIVLSGDVQPQAQARVRALGASGFIKKPVAPATMRAAMLDAGLL